MTAEEIAAGLTDAQPSDILSPDAIRDCLVTTVLATPAQPSGDVVEAVARAIHGAKMPGHNPDCLYEHHDYEPWPVDDRREYADPFTGKPRVQLFHKAWRRYESAATAAITAYEAAARIQALETALAEAEGRVIAEVVAWLRDENGQCDCFARSEGECACGAWDDYKTKPLLDIATALETGEWKK